MIVSVDVEWRDGMLSREDDHPVTFIVDVNAELRYQATRQIPEEYFNISTTTTELNFQPGGVTEFTTRVSFSEEARTRAEAIRLIADAARAHGIDELADFLLTETMKHPMLKS